MDYLVEANILRDTRNIYWNYIPDDGDWSTDTRYPPGQNDSEQQEYASYAIADALKANFNPNCHLNETNPDKNLYLRVDKTDLIVNSTEFCFTPMGYFEVQSVGRILRPIDKESEKRDARSETRLERLTSHVSHFTVDGKEDVFSGPVVEVASSKVQAVVKVFDVYRETTQAQFLRGTISDKQGAEPTNSGKGLEIGPEPQPSEKQDVRRETRLDRFTSSLEYDGYIQLATLGGIENPQGQTETPAGTPHWPTQDIAQYEGLHVHFQFDKKAHHHASADRLGDQFRNEVSGITLSVDSMIGKLDPALLDENYNRIVDAEKGIEDEYLKKRKLRYNLSNYGKIERTENFADDNKGVQLMENDVQRSMLARSFRTNSRDGVSEKRDVRSETRLDHLTSHVSPLTTFVPADLRIDGAYVERNAGLAYWIDEGVSMFSDGGAVSMWIKPSFNLSRTGKVRKIFSYDRWHRSNYTYRNPNMFSLFFMPLYSHDTDRTMAQIASGNSGGSQPVISAGSRKTNRENKPTEISEDGRGVKGIRSASLFGGIYMHQAGGSLEDWEYDLWSRRDTQASNISVGSPGSGGSGPDPDILVKIFMGKLTFREQSSIFGGANLGSSGWESTHIIDTETYSNTPYLGGISARPGGELVAGRWSNITISYSINGGDKTLTGDIISLDQASPTPSTRQQPQQKPATLNMLMQIFAVGGAIGQLQGANIQIPADIMQSYAAYDYTTTLAKLSEWLSKEIEQGREDYNSFLNLSVRSPQVKNYPLSNALYLLNMFGGASSGGSGTGGGFTQGTVYGYKPAKNSSSSIRIFVNGRQLDDFSIGIPGEADEMFNRGARRPVFSLHSFRDNETGGPADKWVSNTIRIGETSTHGFSGIEGRRREMWPRNFSGDFTADEFYVFGSAQESDTARRAELDNIENSLKTVYSHGRYYTPMGPDDSSYESSGIKLSEQIKSRTLKENSLPDIRIIGASYTYYAEDYDRVTLEPVVYDYMDPKMPVPLRPAGNELVRLGIAVYGPGGNQKDEITVGELSKTSQDLREIPLEKEDTIKYKASFNIPPSLSPNTVLLGTPVLDDVTIYYYSGVRLLFYTAISM